MKISVFTKILLVFCLFCAFINMGCSDKRKDLTDGQIANVKIGNHVLKVETAVTDSARAKGLSNRANLPFEGLLFIFDYPHQLVFWMKDMKFPIDIIWINKNKIIKITENVHPQPNTPDYLLKKYTSTYFADTVIELNAGDAQKYGLKVGMKFKILK